MRKIVAIIRPFRLEEVKASLAAMGIPGATVSEVWVQRRRNESGQIYRNSPQREGFLPRVRLELVVTDEQWKDTTTAILRAAKTGIFEDGKIFVTEVVDAVHIRTGEHGVPARAV
jgi:nitrogen regulatory protein P-II 2